MSTAPPWYLRLARAVGLDGDALLAAIETPAVKDRLKAYTDEAIALLTQIIRAPNAPNELRANSMLLGGYIMKDQNQREAAIDYFIKISAFYDGVPGAASTGLWEGGQLLEQQVAELQTSDPEKAGKQREQLLRAYRELSQKFPDSEFAPKAKERLSALGAS
jgi:outer membrane protein assembly factor BamD (BamD/ComL family)